MRLLTYERGGARRLGAWVDGIVVDLPDAVGHPAFPRTMEELVAHNGGTMMEAARAALHHPDVIEEFGVPHPHLLAALLPRAVCEFAPPAEASVVATGAPGPSATPILPPDAVIPWPRRASGMECRVELGTIVGGRGRDLTPRQAGRILFGTTILIRWGGLDAGQASAISLGPAVVTVDESDADGASVRVLVDGEIRADGSLERSSEPFARLVAEASRTDEVGPGDVFGGGGFGALLAVPIRKEDRGAVVEVLVEGVGTLRTRLGRSR